LRIDITNTQTLPWCLTQRDEEIDQRDRQKEGERIIVGKERCTKTKGRERKREKKREL